MTDAAQVKLGKLPPKEDPRTLQMAAYLRRKLPSAPLRQDWTVGMTSWWGMMLNNQLGDCTIAAAGHLIMEWTANLNQEIVLADDTILKAYEAVSGYDPASGANDNGAVELDVLKYWRSTGIGGHTIEAFASVDPGNWEHIKWSVFLFGGAYIGLALPLSAQNQQVWDVTNGPGSEPGSWGGHAVPVVAYDETGLYCVTWGSVLRMTWQFWSEYCDEAYAILSPDWLSQNVDPNNVDIVTLRKDLELVSM